MSCKGDGSCFHQCCCTCFEDEHCEIESEVCTCGHRGHQTYIGGTTELDIYCREECRMNCQLVECNNFRICGKKEPLWFLNTNNVMCLLCAITIGKIKFLDIQDDCPICLETKDIVQICCGKHNLCLDCWKNICKSEGKPACPLCREHIWDWGKRT